MSETSTKFDLEAAETAYTVIASYVEHTQISGIIIALLASHIGEERLKPLVESEHWKNYTHNRKRMLTRMRQSCARRCCDDCRCD